MTKEKKLNDPLNDHRRNRRKIASLAVLGATGAIACNKQWSKPIVDSVILPAHAQTSAMMCTTDTTVGGPLSGHPSGASTCQAACEAEAISRNAGLCGVDEFVDGTGATQCDCELDLP